VTGWLEFLAAFAVFMGSHAIPARPAVRARLARTLGERGYLGAYVAASIASLAWVIDAAGRAPRVALWYPEPWMLWAPALAMPVVCLLIAFAVAAPNPLSFGGARNGRFDPDRPGVAGVARHPLLWALALWSGAHLLPNGDLAHGVLFGGFAAFSVAGMAAIDARLRRRLGPDWARLAARTSLVPFAALLTGRWRPRGGPDATRLALGAGLWLTLLLLHPAVIGVSALPLAPGWWPDPVQLGRAVHVLAVVHWIGGVAMVTLVVLPAASAAAPGERFAAFERIERRFAPQARLSVAAAGLSGFWMTDALGAWSRFLDAGFWWMHGMLAIWLVFSAVLYVAEPLWLDAWARARAVRDEAALIRLMYRAHRVLLGLSLAVTAAAVLGAHGAV
jgi:uncharacterized membrane protein